MKINENIIAKELQGETVLLNIAQEEVEYLSLSSSQFSGARHRISFPRVSVIKCGLGRLNAPQIQPQRSRLEPNTTPKIRTDQQTPHPRRLYLPAPPSSSEKSTWVQTSYDRRAWNRTAGGAMGPGLWPFLRESQVACPCGHPGQNTKRTYSCQGKIGTGLCL